MALNIGPLVVCGLLAGMTGAAQAQSASPAQALLDDKFVFSLGAFVVGSDITARLNGSSTTNPDIDFDETFGKASDATRIRADGLWRITPTHHLRFLYFDNSTSRSRVIDRDIAWGDNTFQAGGLVESETDMKLFELAYEYAFMRRPTYEVSGSIGLHYMDLTQRLSGQATITDANGNQTPVQFTSKQNSVPLPLPVIGIRAGWVVAPQVYLEAQGQIFKAEINGIDGRVTDVRATATWMFNPHFGLGLGYNRFATTADVGKDDFDGRLRLAYSGLQLFVTGAF
jgi:hypothetical protein